MPYIIVFILGFLVNAYMEFREVSVSDFIFSSSRKQEYILLSNKVDELDKAIKKCGCKNEWTIDGNSKERH